LKLDGKIVHISGSASVNTESKLIEYGHGLIRSMVNKLLRRGARFLIQVGKEDHKTTNGSDVPLIFDWTVMSEINNYIIENGQEFKNCSRKPIVTVVKQDFITSIPPVKLNLWRSLMERGALQIEFLEEGWSSGAIRRIRMSELGDILIIISGGEGVEHLAEEYNRQFKPIIPLDLDLGSSKGDGNGGGSKLFKKMLARYDSFISLEKPISAGELFLNIKTDNGVRPFKDVTEGITKLIDNITPPMAFYVRLLSTYEAEYKEVENFFRQVVDPLMKENGYSIKEMGIQKPNDAWMNVEIFENLHKAALVVVDLTGLRPNCLIELGYALGRPSKVILTAKKDTILPFDAKMYECCFWDTKEQIELTAKKLKDYFERNFNRPSVIRYKDVL
jgi:hypothetical protein